MRGRIDVLVDTEETTGANDFKYEKYPDACGVVVDKSSGNGWVQVTGGGLGLQQEETGDGATSFAKLDIQKGQTCMLYGKPTVLYIRPRPRST